MYPFDTILDLNNPARRIRPVVEIVKGSLFVYIDASSAELGGPGRRAILQKHGDLAVATASQPAKNPLAYVAYGSITHAMF